VNLGTENRNKLIASVVLMGIAILLLGRMLFTGGAPAAANPETGVAPVSARGEQFLPRNRAHTLKGRKPSMAPRSIDPTLRTDWLKASEDRKYEGAGRNIFLAQIEIPKPVVPAVPDMPPVAQGPPPPPPINLKFYGYASEPGEPKRIFLSQGEDVFIAGEGDIIDRRYKILRITPTQVEVEDVLNNNRQNIPLTQG
jgi:hypothetical protein